MEKIRHFYWGKTLCSFLLVLLLMPMGHAVMILMEHFLNRESLHYSAFAMGFVGMIITIRGVFVSNETKATVIGLLGGLLFWTGWVEFLFSYYAWRYGTHCDLIGSGIVQTTTEYVDGIGIIHDFTINGDDINSFDHRQIKNIRGSRPEYLILPATFGMWMMIMMLYTFCTRTGCRFFNWLQTVLRLDRKIKIKPFTRIPAITTFMQLNTMMWGCYLLLMFCYDPIFCGSRHWFTIAVGMLCLFGSVLMLRSQLKICGWGPNIRMAIASVIVFWSFVEIVARNGIIQEIWVAPLSNSSQLITLLICIILFPACYLLRKSFTH